MADTREDRMKRRQLRQQEQERKEQERRAAEQREGAEAVEKIRQRLIQMQLRDQGVDLTDEEDRNEVQDREHQPNEPPSRSVQEEAEEDLHLNLSISEDEETEMDTQEEQKKYQKERSM